MNIDFILLLFTGALMGAASAYLGSFMVLKRMSLVGDALSHVALPGIAIALTFNINPILGALTFLFAATVAIWYLDEHSKIYPEALVGVFFTSSLALGLLLTPRSELLEALFGDIDKITRLDSLFVVLASIVIFVITFLISKKLLLGVVSEDLAKSQKINVSKINLIYLLLVSLVVSIGIKFLGTLLTGAMVILPAALSKNIAKNITSFQATSIVAGGLSVTLGIVLARNYGLPSGPLSVMVAASLFLLSYIFKKNS